MNLFGFEIKRNNSRYVYKVDCQRLQDGMHKRITEVEDHIITLITQRLDDIKDLINASK